jgi:erythromycin esterase-like protein
MTDRAVVASPAAALARHARRWTGSLGEDRDFVDRLAPHQLVLLGEATHGSREFYRERARVTRALIEHHGLTAVAIEGDWPDAYRVNRYVLGQSSEASAEQALRGFRRFPTWMWRNREVLDFVTWLRQHNADLPAERRVRFYGLDLYSLAASMEAVVGYLDGVDPAEADRARARYACFDRFGEPEGQAYGYALAHQGAVPCEDEVVTQLVSLRARTADYLRRDGMDAFDEAFFAEQNAVVVRDAEEYYQQMYRADVSSWNLRDRHMANTADALMEHLRHHQPHPKLAIWEHNSHVGDARATGMSQRGELNVGQLVRQRYSNAPILVGFTTYHGEVTAARDWGGVAERRRVRPSLPDSHEALLHATGVAQGWFDCSEGGVHELFATPRLERAIGVIYRPETERPSHYFPAVLADQFDLVVHIDRTHAVEPLEPGAPWVRGEPPETYPTGL